MVSRDELALQLLATGYVNSCGDYCRVATFLQCNNDKGHILAMPELERWPMAFTWLKERL